MDVEFKGPPEAKPDTLWLSLSIIAIGSVVALVYISKYYEKEHKKYLKKKTTP